MVLKVDVPPVKKERPVFDVTGFSSHFFQPHIGALIVEDGFSEVTLGVDYAFVPGRWGWFFSTDYCVDESFCCYTGPELRMLDTTSDIDWHVFLGAGGKEDVFGVNLGARFGWKSDKELSRYDFTVGLQCLSDGVKIPYLGLSLTLSGYTLVIALGVTALASEEFEPIYYY